MTNFRVGQRYYANVEAQGLTKDHPYQVMNVFEKVTPFGNFVTLEVWSLRNEPSVVIANPHLVLRKDY